MKKILALLALLFTTACVGATTQTNLCADGSERIKTVASGGDYYVYKCSTSTTSSNTLKQIKVVENWEPVLNFDAIKEYGKVFKPRWDFNDLKNTNCDDLLMKGKIGDDVILNKLKPKGDWVLRRCKIYYHNIAQKDPQVIGDVLLAWATSKKDYMKPPVRQTSTGYNVRGYILPSLVGTFTQFYALWYEEMNYTVQERKLVDTYLVNNLMSQTLPALNRGTRRCNPKDPYDLLKGTRIVAPNTCGNIMQKVAFAEIMLGFRLENQALLDKGHDDQWTVLSTINEDGININHATKGASNVDYMWDYMHYQTMLAELYKSVGFDYFEMTLPHGAKVHEYITMSYKILKDFKITSEYCKVNNGSLFNKCSKIANMTQEEFQANNHYTYAWEYGDLEFVKVHTSFVKRFMPKLFKKYTAREIRMFFKGAHTLGTNRGISPYAFYVGNNPPKKVEKAPIDTNWRKNYQFISTQ